LNSNGSITAWLCYDAWGVTRSSSGTTPTGKRYTGQYESEAGLYFYQSRFYDPQLGRFTQADTIIPEAGDPSAWDRYAYVNNNPLIYSDPSGHNGVLIAGALGGALGGVIYGYGSQVINNLNQGMNLGSALTTNISGSSIALYTVVGGLIGTGIAPLIAPVASSIASVITPAGVGTTSTGVAAANQACDGDLCLGELSDAIKIGKIPIESVTNSQKIASQLQSKSQILDIKISGDMSSISNPIVSRTLERLNNISTSSNNRIWAGRWIGKDPINVFEFIEGGLGVVRSQSTGELISIVSRVGTNFDKLQYLVEKSQGIWLR
jgi:RHS repeat-associated protein